MPRRPECNPTHHRRSSSPGCQVREWLGFFLALPSHIVPLFPSLFFFVLFFSLSLSLKKCLLSLSMSCFLPSCFFCPPSLLSPYIHSQNLLCYLSHVNLGLGPGVAESRLCKQLVNITNRPPWRQLPLRERARDRYILSTQTKNQSHTLNIGGEVIFRNITYFFLIQVHSLKYEIFSVLSMAQQNYIFGFRDEKRAIDNYDIASRYFSELKNV